jgi:hypothetical protein
LQASNARPLWQFKALDDFLDHTARAEAIFWPREKYEARGKDLRRLVALEGSNPLHDHRLRNRLQHFDESLETGYRSQIRKRTLVFFASTPR